MYNIFMEDLAANAFIYLLRKKLEITSITYHKLEAYGAKAIEDLKKLGKEARLILSRAETDKFYGDCYQFFKPGKDGVQITEGTSVSDLIFEFRGAIALDVLLVLSNTDVLSILD